MKWQESKRKNAGQWNKSCGVEDQGSVNTSAHDCETAPVTTLFMTGEENTGFPDLPGFCQ
jgi:hypothetical protein